MTNLVIFVMLLSLAVLGMGQRLQENVPEDEDLYALALLNMLRQHQAAAEQQQQQQFLQMPQEMSSSSSFDPMAAAQVAADKRSSRCLKRNANCDGRINDCCSGSTCRCTLIGSNCRCQRPGLFQKLF